MEPSSSSATNPSINTSDSTGDIGSKESNKRTKTENTDESVAESKGDDGQEAQDVKVTNAKSSNELNLVEESPGEMIEFNVVYMKKSHKISMKSTETIGHLKSHLGKKKVRCF